MRSHSQTARARIRRMQLERIDMTDRNKLDQIVETPIATVEGILSLPPPGPSPILRGTAGKYLSTAMASVAGYRGAPIRKMKNLLSKLCTPGKAYPYAELPPKGPGEEVEDLINEVMRLMPYLRHPESTNLARRSLNLMEKTFPITPANLRKAKRSFIAILTRADATFVPPPEPITQRELYDKLFAPPPLTLAEQLQAFSKMPPAGHA